MRICVAQPRPVKGDVSANISKHVRLIELAIAENTDLIVFQELSITGYEPDLVENLAMAPDDQRLNVFQELSDTHGLSIGVGIPLKNTSGIQISMVIFHPDQKRQVYAKQFLHVDEEAYFIPGPETTGLLDTIENAALAICYEITIPEHAERANRNCADYYIASVVKSINGVERAIGRLSEIAKRYGMTTLLSNCVGESEDYTNGGKSSVWNAKGELIGQLDQEHEGVLIYDTNTNEAITRLLG